MKYGGLSVVIDSRFFNIRKRFSIDLAVGDIITPRPIKRAFSNHFSKEEYEVLAYSPESIIAEKFETLISKGVNNSRSKDLLPFKKSRLQQGYFEQCCN